MSVPGWEFLSAQFDSECRDGVRHNDNGFVRTAVAKANCRITPNPQRQTPGEGVQQRPAAIAIEGVSVRCMTERWTADIFPDGCAVRQPD